MNLNKPLPARLIFCTRRGQARNEVPKTYLVKIEGTINEQDLNPIRSGIEIEGYKTKKCKAHIVETNKAYTKIHITITLGLFKR